MIRFYGEELLAPSPTPKLEDHPSLAIRNYYLIYIRSYSPYWRPFLHPPPEDAPCRGNRDPLTYNVKKGTHAPYVRGTRGSLHLL
jgi:hypothetical protein